MFSETLDVIRATRTRALMMVALALFALLSPIVESQFGRSSDRIIPALLAALMPMNGMLFVILVAKKRLLLAWLLFIGLSGALFFATWRYQDTALFGSSFIVIYLVGVGGAWRAIAAPPKGT